MYHTQLNNLYQSHLKHVCHDPTFSNTALCADVSFVAIDTIENGDILLHTSGLKFKIIEINEACDGINDLLVTAVSDKGNIEHFTDEYLSMCYNVNDIHMFETFNITEKEQI